MLVKKYDKLWLYEVITSKCIDFAPIYHKTYILTLILKIIYLDKH